MEYQYCPGTKRLPGIFVLIGKNWRKNDFPNFSALPFSMALPNRQIVLSNFRIFVKI